MFPIGIRHAKHKYATTRQQPVNVLGDTCRIINMFQHIKSKDQIKRVHGEFVRKQVEAQKRVGERLGKQERIEIRSRNVLKSLGIQQVDKSAKGTSNLQNTLVLV